MSVPDELVAAAAEALCIGTHRGLHFLAGRPCDECLRRSRIALQAAFAKLPECDAAFNVVVSELVDWTGDPEDADGVPLILAALAREFGGRE